MGYLQIDTKHRLLNQLARQQVFIGCIVLYKSLLSNSLCPINNLHMYISVMILKETIHMPQIGSSNGYCHLNSSISIFIDCDYFY